MKEWIPLVEEYVEWFSWYEGPPGHPVGRRAGGGISNPDKIWDRNQIQQSDLLSRWMFVNEERARYIGLATSKSGTGCACWVINWMRPLRLLVILNCIPLFDSRWPKCTVGIKSPRPSAVWRSLRRSRRHLSHEGRYYHAGTFYRREKE